MRGGEAMALGISAAFPLSMFVHASDPSDIKLHHLDGQATVILVDSVINSGKTIRQFVQHIRASHPRIRTVVVAGVVQAESVAELTTGWLDVAIAALRLSNNKFTGTGTTDTGNRLYNTTHLP